MFTPDGSLIEKEDKPSIIQVNLLVLMFPGDHTLFRCDGQSAGLHPLLDFYLQQASVRSVPQTGPETEGPVPGPPGGETETQTEGCHGEAAVPVPVTHCGRPGPADQQVDQHDGLAGQV